MSANLGMWVFCKEFEEGGVGYMQTARNTFRVFFRRYVRVHLEGIAEA